MTEYHASVLSLVPYLVHDIILLGASPDQDRVIRTEGLRLILATKRGLFQAARIEQALISARQGPVGIIQLRNSAHPVGVWRALVLRGFKLYGINDITRRV